jgi:lipopolysaccharide transport system permease protein
LNPHSQSTHSLPDEPLAVIEPRNTWTPVNFKELWEYRELLYFLTWRDLKVRYKQTVLGVVWVVMQPILMTLIFTVFLGMLARVPSGGMPYALIAYTGLLVWGFFSSTVTGASYCLVGNANLITKVYFPRVLIPAANVGARLVDLAISVVILAVLMVFYSAVLHYKFVLTWRLVAVLPLLLLTTLLAFAIGMLVAALNVTYRDVGVALGVVIQLWMFVSPVIYPVSLVPQKYRVFYDLNPLVGLIDGFRVALFGGQFDLFALGVSVVVSVAALIIAAYVFRGVEKTFADLI